MQGDFWGCSPRKGSFLGAFWDEQCLDRRAVSVEQGFIKFSQAARNFCHLAAAGGSLGSAGSGERALGRFSLETPLGSNGKVTGEKGNANPASPGLGLVGGR